MDSKALVRRVLDLGLNVQNEVDDPLTGNDPRIAWAILNAMEKAVKDAKDMVRPVVVQEVEKYGREGVVIGELRLTYQSGRRQWKYEGVTQVAELDKKLKAAQLMAQAACDNGAMIADSDGVVVNPAQCTYTADTVVVTQVK